MKLLNRIIALFKRTKYERIRISDKELEEIHNNITEMWRKEAELQYTRESPLYTLLKGKEK